LLLCAGELECSTKDGMETLNCLLISATSLQDIAHGTGYIK
jgi:hypothetical protein